MIGPTFTVQAETCSACDHQHGGEDVAFICIGCPCDERPGAAVPKKRKRSSTSPTQRTLAECRKRGYIVQVVERWNPHARKRIDLFGVIDVVAIDDGTTIPHAGGGRILGIQACSGTDHAKRRAKILAEPRAKQWVEAGGRLELWSWSKRGERGKQKRWALRVEVFTVEDWRTT